MYCTYGWGAGQKVQYVDKGRVIVVTGVYMAGKGEQLLHPQAIHWLHMKKIPYCRQNTSQLVFNCTFLVDISMQMKCKLQKICILNLQQLYSRFLSMAFTMIKRGAYSMYGRVGRGI
jgi:hypothetical protein